MPHNRHEHSFPVSARKNQPLHPNPFVLADSPLTRLLPTDSTSRLTRWALENQLAVFQAQRSISIPRTKIDIERKPLKLLTDHHLPILSIHLVSLLNPH